MSIEKIPSILPVYPIKKTDKALRDDQKSDKNQARQDKEKDQKKSANSTKDSTQHIDEIV